MFLPRKHSKLCVLILFLVLFNLILYLEIYISKTVNDNHDIQLETRLINVNLKRDWHNYEAIKAALARKGPGEVGAAVDFDEYKKQLYEEYGFHATLSDQISLNRSVPDVRPKDCMSLSYLAQLPKTAIIITFHNERLSVLLRTIYSIINRTPDELIQEIILVDDGSSWTDLSAPLYDYLSKHFALNRSKVHLLRLPQRAGLIVARMTGARAASKQSEVLIFLDSHFEMNYNWLPPLLEPIVQNSKACTVPALDSIYFKTFEYKKDEPFRGYFDWELNFQMRPLKSEELEKPAKNFQEYIMIGGAMAIDTAFFWHIGGFDEGMEFWGGEQFEMSFKIWMCGGELISVPCSRIGHIFRDPNTKGNTNLYGNYSFIEKNFRRLVNVWLDEKHRQYVFNHRPAMKTVDPGDLTERFAIHKRLQCKSFSWMLEHIMPDIKAIHPPIEPDDYGHGFIRSLFYDNRCLTIDKEKKVVLADCNKKTFFQDFRFTWRCELRIDGNICLESDILGSNVNTYSCHLLAGNQKWYYDPIRQWIGQLENDVCMIADLKNSRVKLAKCNSNNMHLKWIMEFVNQTAIQECSKPTVN